MTGTRPMAMQFARIGDLVNQDKRAGEEGSFLYRHGSARPYGIHTSLHLSGKSTPWQAPRTFPTRHGPARPGHLSRHQWLNSKARIARPGRRNMFAPTAIKDVCIP